MALDYVGMCRANMCGAVLEDSILYVYILQSVFKYYVHKFKNGLFVKCVRRWRFTMFACVGLMLWGCTCVCVLGYSVCVCVLGYSVSRALYHTLRGRGGAPYYTLLFRFGAYCAIRYLSK